ncbi:MAG: hypothetical protein IH940_02000 [Acidobacteria bacterium]|nr:hypothetical protein [Acidobacteriota bacterium]
MRARNKNSRHSTYDAAHAAPEPVGAGTAKVVQEPLTDPLLPEDSANSEEAGSSETVPNVEDPIVVEQDSSTEEVPVAEEAAASPAATPEGE